MGLLFLTQSQCRSFITPQASAIAKSFVSLRLQLPNPVINTFTFPPFGGVGGKKNYLSLYFCSSMFLIYLLPPPPFSLFFLSVN